MKNKSSIFYNTSARHKRHECDTRDMSATRVQYECCKNDTSATRKTRVRHELKILIFITTQVKTYNHTAILAVWQIKDYRKRNNFILRTTFYKYNVPMPNAFEKCTTKTKLCNRKSYIKKLYLRL